jgi:hypothetical protein
MSEDTATKGTDGLGMLPIRSEPKKGPYEVYTEGLYRAS